MAYRGLLKIKRTPEQLFDVTLQPIIFTLMFTYIFGGAIAGNVSHYLPIIIPGILAQTVIGTSIVTGVQLREDMEKGVFDRFRSLPIARVAPLAGALLADTVRYLIATVLTLLMGLIMGYTAIVEHPAGVVGAGLLVIVDELERQLDLRAVRDARPQRLERAGHLDADPVPAHVPLERLRAHLDDARLAADVREHQPDLAPHHRGARADQHRHGRPPTSGSPCSGPLVIVAVFAPLTVRAYMRKA